MQVCEGRSLNLRHLAEVLTVLLLQAVVQFGAGTGADAASSNSSHACLRDPDCAFDSFCNRPVGSSLHGSCSSCWRCCLLPDLYGDCSDRCHCAAGEQCVVHEQCGRGLFCAVPDPLNLPICQLCTTCTSDALSVSGSCSDACPSGVMSSLTLSGLSLTPEQYSFYAFYAADIGFEPDTNPAALPASSLRGWLSQSGLSDDQTVHALSVLDPFGDSTVPLTDWIARVSTYHGNSLICPQLTVGNASAAPAVVFAGCYCNATVGARSFRCPAGTRCSRSAYHGLGSDLLTDYTAVTLAALCVACEPGQFCAEGSYSQDESDLSTYTCPSGYYCPNPAIKLPCPAGSYCVSQTIVPITCDYEYRLQNDPYGAVPLEPQNVIHRLRDNRDPIKGNLCPVGSSKPTTLCRAGTYCPTTSTSLPCPSGYFCKAQSVSPWPCSLLTHCPEGTASPKLSGLAFVAAGAVLLGLPLVWFFSSRLGAGVETEEDEKEVTRAVAMRMTANLLARAVEDKYQGFGVISPAVHLEFEDLGMVLKGPEGEVVLHGVSGTFAPRKLNAIMGPSGCGKTTFLNVLCGAQGSGIITGKVRINGDTLPLSRLTKVLGYVPQDDIVHEDLTVRENLSYSARLRVPLNVSDRRRKAIVDDALDMLSLKAIQHVRVGSVEKRGISGGQRKRVNIGLELVSLPSVLFLDEPTSGLDASSSSHILASLSDMAALGMNITAVIHQPRFSSFMLFDQVLLLAVGGRTVYMGSPAAAVLYFQSHLGFRFPDQENPADILMDIVAGKLGGSKRTKFTPASLVQQWHHGGKGWVASFEELNPGVRNKVSAVDPEVLMCIDAEIANIDETGTGRLYKDQLMTLFERLGQPMEPEDAALLMQRLAGSNKRGSMGNGEPPTDGKSSGKGDEVTELGKIAGWVPEASAAAGPAMFVPVEALLDAFHHLADRGGADETHDRIHHLYNSTFILPENGAPTAASNGGVSRGTSDDGTSTRSNSTCSAGRSQAQASFLDPTSTSVYPGAPVIPGSAVQYLGSKSGMLSPGSTAATASPRAPAQTSYFNSLPGTAMEPSASITSPLRGGLLAADLREASGSYPTRKLAHDGGNSSTAWGVDRAVADQNASDMTARPSPFTRTSRGSAYQGRPIDALLATASGSFGPASRVSFEEAQLTHDAKPTAVAERNPSPWVTAAAPVFTSSNRHASTHSGYSSMQTAHSTSPQMGMAANGREISRQDSSTATYMSLAQATSLTRTDSIQAATAKDSTGATTPGAAADASSAGPATTAAATAATAPAATAAAHDARTSPIPPNHASVGELMQWVQRMQTGDGPAAAVTIGAAGSDLEPPVGDGSFRSTSIQRAGSVRPTPPHGAPNPPAPSQPPPVLSLAPTPPANLRTLPPSAAPLLPAPSPPPPPPLTETSTSKPRPLRTISLHMHLDKPHTPDSGSDLVLRQGDGMHPPPCPPLLPAPAPPPLPPSSPPSGSATGAPLLLSADHAARPLPEHPSHHSDLSSVPSLELPPAPPPAPPSSREGQQQLQQPAVASASVPASSNLSSSSSAPVGQSQGGLDSPPSRRRSGEQKFYQRPGQPTLNSNSDVYQVDAAAEEGQRTLPRQRLETQPSRFLLQQRRNSLQPNLQQVAEHEQLVKEAAQLQRTSVSGFSPDNLSGMPAWPAGQNLHPASMQSPPTVNPILDASNAMPATAITRMTSGVPPSEPALLLSSLLTPSSSDNSSRHDPFLAALQHAPMNSLFDMAPPAHMLAAAAAAAAAAAGVGVIASTGGDVLRTSPSYPARNRSDGNAGYIIAPPTQLSQSRSAIFNLLQPGGNSFGSSTAQLQPGVMDAAGAAGGVVLAADAEQGGAASASTPFAHASAEPWPSTPLVHRLEGSGSVGAVIPVQSPPCQLDQQLGRGSKGTGNSSNWLGGSGGFDDRETASGGTATQQPPSPSRLQSQISPPLRFVSQHLDMSPQGTVNGALVLSPTPNGTSQNLLNQTTNRSSIHDSSIALQGLFSVSIPSTDLPAQGHGNSHKGRRGDSPNRFENFGPRNRSHSQGQVQINAATTTIRSALGRSSVGGYVGGSSTGGGGVRSTGGLGSGNGALGGSSNGVYGNNASNNGILRKNSSIGPSGSAGNLRVVQLAGNSSTGGAGPLLAEVSQLSEENSDFEDDAELAHFKQVVFGGQEAGQSPVRSALRGGSVSSRSPSKAGPRVQISVGGVPGHTSQPGLLGQMAPSIVQTAPASPTLNPPSRTHSISSPNRVRVGGAGSGTSTAGRKREKSHVNNLLTGTLLGVWNQSITAARANHSITQAVTAGRRDAASSFPHEVSQSGFSAAMGMVQVLPSIAAMAHSITAKRMLIKQGGSTMLQLELSRRKFPTPWSQFRPVLRRSLVKSVRAFWPTKVLDILLLLLGAFIVGLIHGTDWGISAVPSNAVMAMVCLGVLSTICHLRTFSTGQLLLKREASGGLSMSSYFLAQNLLDCVWLLATPAVYLGPYFYLTLPRMKFAEYYSIALQVCWWTSGLAYLVAAILPPQAVLMAGVFAALILGAFVSGLTPPVADVRGGVLEYLMGVSYNRWAVEALSIQELRYYQDSQRNSALMVMREVGICRIDELLTIDSDGSDDRPLTPREAISFLHLQYNFTYDSCTKYVGIAAGALVAMGVLFRILAFCVLRAKNARR